MREAADKNVENEVEVIDRVVHLNRVAKTVKGGRRMNFSALVVAGDGEGKVGVGLGKAHEVPEAIRKGLDRAKKRMVPVALKEGTIPHEVIGHFGASKVVLRPARPGTGVIAGGAVRAIMEAVGVKNILTKCIGTNNPHNIINATMEALSRLQSDDEIKQKLGK